MEIEKIKSDFPILQNKNITYLDSGATAQKPRQVLEAIENFYEKYNANPHRGAYSLSMEATEIYESTRKKIADFINAKYKEEIIFTKNATESLNLIAYSYGIENVKKDNGILISIMEHHSNLVIWQKVSQATDSNLEYMYINKDFEIPDEEIEKKITNKTKIVSIAHISNVLGTKNNVKKIIEQAHKVGAIVIVDAAQSVPHMKIDVQDIDADFAVFSGHKMLAPLGIGVLYGKKQLLENMVPFIMGGDMIEYVYEQETTFAELPHKFEAGTQNVGGAIGLASAIKYLENIGFDNIHKLEQEIVEYAKQELSKLEYVETYYTPNKENHCSVISFNIKGVHPHDLATILDSCNVAIRAGDHCAQPLIRYMNIPATCRATFYIYNTKQDVDKLVQGLQKAYNMFSKFIH